MRGAVASMVVDGQFHAGAPSTAGFPSLDNGAVVGVDADLPQHVPPAPPMPAVPDEFTGDFVVPSRRRPPTAPPMPSLPPGY